MNSRIFFLTIFIFASSQSLWADIPWKEIVSSDTFAVFLKKQPVGTEYSSTIVDSSRSLIVVRHVLEISPATPRDSMIIEELREYDYAGRLCSAHQSLRSQSGLNQWGLQRMDSAWELTVTTAGVASKSRVTGITESLVPTFQVFKAIVSGSAQLGSIWRDSGFDLLSAKSFTTTTLCVDTPGKSNGQRWILLNRNSLVGMDEHWELDKSGRTVRHEIAPLFTAERISGPQRNSTIKSVDMNEEFKIACKGILKKDRPIQLKFLDSLEPNVTVRTFYEQTGKLWSIKPTIKTCDSTITISKLFSDCIATPMMQTDQPQLRLTALAIPMSGSTMCDTLASVNRWVYNNLEKRSAATFSSALETLKSGFGDCGEHAVLCGALLRCLNIPAHIVFGLVYIEQKKGFFYHAWVGVSSDNGWLFVDPALNIFPAFGDRIPLIIDDEGRDMMLIGNYIGKIKIMQ